MITKIRKNSKTNVLEEKLKRIIEICNFNSSEIVPTHACGWKNAISLFICSTYIIISQIQADLHLSSI